MEHRPIATSSDLEVSVFALGTMTFGAESDQAESHDVLDRYYELGGRLVDTADVYSAGVSEQIIGEWLADRGHDDVLIATKARFGHSGTPGDGGAGSAYLEVALDASLQRLGVEHVDLYQIHAWDPAVTVEETMGTLDGFVDAGKVRAIGVSNYLGWQLERAVQVSDRNGWVPVSTLQPQYNLLDRQIELDSMPVALDHGIGLLPWSPLGGGWLTGKYRADQRPTGKTRLGEDPGRGVEAYDRRNVDKTWQVLEVVEAIASDRGVGMAEVALNWVKDRPGVVSVLLGARTVNQLGQNMAALEWTLSDEEMDRLNSVSAPGIPDYPHRFLHKNAGVNVWEELGTGVPD